MPNDSNYENYVVNDSTTLYSVLLKETNTTSHNVICYTGYYTGGAPVVMDAKPFDVARDLSTGNLWQFTGTGWIPAMWNSAITFFLGAATTVCERLRAEGTSIPSGVEVYYGTDDEVPPELSLSADDLAIKHDISNYNVQVKVFRTDVTTDTIVDVPFPEGSIISTEDGNWTVLKNFNGYVGFDYATISLIWTGAGGDSTPMINEYVTSATLDTALSMYPTSEVVSSIVESAIGSGGTTSGALVSGAAFITTVGDATLGFSDRGLNYSGGDSVDNVEFNLGAGGAVGGIARLNASYEIALSGGGAVTTTAPTVNVSAGSSAVFRAGAYTVLLTESGIVASGASGEAVVLSNGIISAETINGAVVSIDENGVRLADVFGGSAGVNAGRFFANSADVGELVISGDGFSAEFSSGVFIASGASGECVVLSGGTAKLMNDYDYVEQYVAVDQDNGISISAADPGRNVNIECGAGDINLNTSHGGAVKINDVPVITQLIRAVDSSFNTSAQVRVSGGTQYIYPNPLDQLMVGVAEDSRESYIQFTLTSSGVLIVPSTLALLNSEIEFEGGKTYLLGFLNGMMAASELTEGTGSYGSFAVKFWDTGNIYNFSFFSGDFYNQYYLCADLPGYSIVINQHDDNGQNTQGSFYGPDGTLLSSGEGAGDDIAGIAWDSEDYSIQYMV